MVDPEPELPDSRLNDAGVDQQGRLWAGTMDAAIRHPSGSLYRLDPELSVSRRDAGYLVTNGPVFGRSHGHPCHNDTGGGLVYRFDLTLDGALENKMVLLRFPQDGGRPMA